MTIKKTQGVQTTDYLTLVWLQEIIADYIRQVPTGKAVIDAEKVTFSKFGLKLGLARHSTNGIVYSNGHLSYRGSYIPSIKNTTVLEQLKTLFNM